MVVSNGEGQLTIAAAGVSGSIAATVLVDIPGVKLTGTFGIAFDTATSTLKVSATNAALEVVGQRLTGNFEFEKTSTAIKLKLGPNGSTDFVELNFGNGTATFVSVKLRGELVLNRAELVECVENIRRQQLRDDAVDGLERQPLAGELDLPRRRHDVRLVARVHDEGFAVDADNRLEQ